MTFEGFSGNDSLVDSAVSIEIESIHDRTEECCIQTTPSSDQSPSTAIVEAIGAITDTDPIELDPLGDWIDVDHLDGLFDSSSHSERGHVSVSFSYAGYRISVTETTLINRAPTS